MPGFQLSPHAGSLHPFQENSIFIPDGLHPQSSLPRQAPSVSHLKVPFLLPYPVGMNPDLASVVDSGTSCLVTSALMSNLELIS